MDIDPGTASSQPSANPSAAQICLIRLALKEATRRPNGISNARRAGSHRAGAAHLAVMVVGLLYWVAWVSTILSGISSEPDCIHVHTL
jgi:hypothetical protein